MDQQPNYRRRRIAFAAAALALLALTNRPDPTQTLGVIAIDSSDDGAIHMTAAAMPLLTGAATLATWATERLTR